MRNIEESIGDAATNIAKDIDANCIISIERKKSESYEDSFHIDVKVTFFKKIKKGVYRKTEYETKIRKIDSGTISPIKDLLVEGINKKYIDKGDRVVCVQDESMGTGYKGMLFIFDVDKLFFDISTHNLAENTNSEIIETVLNIAQELSKEGREGRKIGTAFIIGDKSEIMKYTKQLIINPFAGYSDDLKKITDPLIKETVKEFAQLDGVFVLHNDGTIVTTGAYIDIDTGNIELPSGFGTRHRCCAALTKETNAIAVVVSESGGSIRIFKDGKITMKL